MLSTQGTYNGLRKHKRKNLPEGFELQANSNFYKDSTSSW